MTRSNICNTISEIAWDISAVSPAVDKQGHIANDLCQRIRAGEFKPGEQLPLYKELEQDYEVSRATLQHAMNRLKREGFIRTEGRRGAYVADFPPCLFRYGLVLPTAGYDAPGFWRSVKEVLNDRYHSENGTRIKVYQDVQIHIDNEPFQQLYTDVQQQRLAGLIMMGGHGALFEMDDWFSSDMPGVSFAPRAVRSKSKHLGLEYMNMDMHQFSRKALDHLMSQGCKNIAIIGPPYMPYFQFFRDDMKQRHLKIYEPWLLRTAMEQPQCARDVARLLFSYSEYPDGLVIVDDNLVEHTMAGIVESRVNVPLDLKIVAHCNWPLPPTQVVPCELLGFEAAEVLEHAINIIEALRHKKEKTLAYPIAPRFAFERIATD